LSRYKAAFITQCMGPVLIGKSHSKTPGGGECGGFCIVASAAISACPSPVSVESQTRPLASKCAVPAISHSRYLSVSSWRTPRSLRKTSVSAMNTRTGTSRSSRIGVGAGTATAGSGGWEREGPPRAAVHEVAVEHVDERMDGVDVGHQAARGLRLAHGDYPLRCESTQEQRRAAAHRLARPPTTV